MDGIRSVWMYTRAAGRPRVALAALRARFDANGGVAEQRSRGSTRAGARRPTRVLSTKPALQMVVLTPLAKRGGVVSPRQEIV